LLLTNKHKKQYAHLYLICFLTNYTWFFYENLLLSQMRPLIFTNRLDLTFNILMLSGIHQLLKSNNGFCILFDILYFLLPLLMTISIVYEWKGRKMLVIAVSLFSLLYGTLISAFSYFSIEFFSAWIFIPLIFYASSQKGFYYLLHCIRIIFIISFFSAGLWKIRAGGIFNTEQMSAILMRQHKQFLITNPEHWYAQIIYFLINHKTVSFFLYILATIGELFFITGLFTQKFDKIMLWILVLFLIFNLGVMQIFYFGWLIFSGLFYYSKFKLNER
jgi:hypothetical protein